MDLDASDAVVKRLIRRLRRIGIRARYLSDTSFFQRNRLMALSDDVIAVTSSLSQVAAEFPSAISTALSSALSTGEASGGNPALSSAVSSLVSQTSTTVGALQSALGEANNPLS